MKGITHTQSSSSLPVSALSVHANYTTKRKSTRNTVEKGLREAIRERLMVGYNNAIRKAKRAKIPCLSAHFLWGITIVGGYPDGLRMCEIAKIGGQPRATAYQRVKRIERKGFMIKSGTRYVLSPSGRAAYEVVCAAFDVELEFIIAGLTAEVRSRLNS